MRFLSIYLNNYIGIYNGMGLYEIFIDMTKCRNRITIIRGDNGSGKSTLSKAMNLFPDPNEAFIPGMKAVKEIFLLDNNVKYNLCFIHDVKPTGERTTTKAYIRKSINDGPFVELNENGNVTSYKDILYDELGLDTNFAALSQLSNDDRGLVDKKPAERKRFVNSIISSLEVYNDIYKTLTKKSTNFKSMINSITAKLNMIGSEENIANELESVENNINTLQNLKDKAIQDLATCQSTISILDPDGSIQEKSKTANADYKKYTAEYEKIKSIMDSIIKSNYITSSNYKDGYNKIVEEKTSLITQNQIDKSSLETLLIRQEEKLGELNRKIQSLNSIESEYDYNTSISMRDKLMSELKQIHDYIYSNTGIDNILSITKDEYIVAIKSLEELSSDIKSFRQSVDLKTSTYLINTYVNFGRIDNKEDISGIDNDISILKEREAKVNSEINSIESKLSLLDILNIKPKDCVDDSCPFIKDAMDFSKTNPVDRLSKLGNELEDIHAQIRGLEQAKIDKEKFNSSIDIFKQIVKEVEKNRYILSKLQNGEMFDNISDFFNKLMANYSFEYMDKLYECVDIANMIDVYKEKKSSLEKINADIKIHENNEEFIKSINSDIDSINSTLTDISNNIESINAEIANRNISIAKLQNLESAYISILDNEEKANQLLTHISEIEANLSDINNSMQSIGQAISDGQIYKNDIIRLGNDIQPLMKRRDYLNHSIQMMSEYKMELQDLQSKYDFVETLKYYSSPTTGIQLVFMELYMGKIIALANELLSLLFNNQFVIQPFIINDTEFRIPCLGSGYLNDDISSMSSSQKGMISMILSFSLLHHSSTKYNIIKLDEIDGPLDYNNRLFFIDVLNRIMDIMGTEQCIMISHNSELQVDESDIILLKHDKDNVDYRRGNIIWSY